MRILRKCFYYVWSVIEMLASFRSWGTLFQLFLVKPTGGLYWLRFWHKPLKIAVRGKMDAWSVKECFLDRFYTRYGCEIEEDWTVVDIGAAIGEFTVLAAQTAKSGRVFAFEPNPESLDILKENIKANNINNVALFNLGVWDKPGQLELDLSGNEPLRAQSIEVAASMNTVNRIQVISLEQLTLEYVSAPIDLLKLDCEGAEYPILLPAGQETMQKIKRIVMEYHDLDNGNNHQALVGFLAKQGYKITSHSNPVHQELGYLFAERNQSTMDR